MCPRYNKMLDSLMIVGLLIIVQASCTPLTPSSVRFSMKNVQNRAGKWTVQVAVASHKEAAWALEVEKNTTLNRDSEEVNVVATFSDVSHSNVEIPAGYEYFPGVGYYKFRPEGATWPRARQLCAEDGGHLVIVNSENEANVLKQLFTRFPKEVLKNVGLYDGIWVGVYEQGASGKYFTIFGNPLESTGFSRWHQGQPAVSGSDECVYLFRETAGLCDYSCGSTATFACELQT